MLLGTISVSVSSVKCARSADN